MPGMLGIKTKEIVRSSLIYALGGFFFTNIYANNCEREMRFRGCICLMNVSVEEPEGDSIKNNHTKPMMNTVYRYKMKGLRSGKIMYENIKLDDSGNLFLWISIRSKDSAWALPFVNKSKYYIEANCLIEDELYKINSKTIGHRLTKYKIRKKKLIRVSAKSPYKEKIEYKRVGRQVYRIVNN